ncbi:hypothetical protein NC651_021818 [Populus alba x Populus x berolinensis]|nr:hypothetical protein NC651_021818 [Populus alba x Populus x berolinensis]
MPGSVPTTMPGVTDKLENQHATKSSAGGGSLSYLDAVKEWMRIGTVCIGDTLSISLYQKPDVAGLNKWMDSDLKCPAASPSRISRILNDLA